MSTVALDIEDAGTDGYWRCTWSLDGAPAGDPVEVPPRAAAELVTFTNQFQGRAADGRGLRPLFPAETLPAVGQALADRFGGAAWPSVLGRMSGDRHRLLVRSKLPEPLNLPWELLPIGTGGDSVGCAPDWSLFRLPFADAAGPEPPLRGGPLRLLFVAAAPDDQQQLDYEQEEDAILKATLKLSGVELRIGEMGTFEELRSLVAEFKPHVVHLSGHGSVDAAGAGRFCFEDERGNVDARAATELAHSVFEGSGVRCVFLNACKTSQAAAAGLCQELVRAGIPLAVGWAASVADDLATHFAEEFYRQVLAGEPVPAALALARLDIRRRGFHPGSAQGRDAQDATFILPQLYCRVPVDLLFDDRPDRREKLPPAPKTEYQLLPGGVEGLREGFVGRRREQQRLIPPLREGELTVAVITGVGGQGKSTLATRVANRLGLAGFEVVAVKALKNGPHESEAACAQRAFQALLEEVRGVCRRNKRKDLADPLTDPGATAVDRARDAVDALGKLKVLLVLDNLEDAMDQGSLLIQDEGLTAFCGRLMTHLTAGSRVLITSRYRPKGLPEPTRVVKLCEPLTDFRLSEFVKFLKRDETVAELIYRGRLTEEVLERLFAAAGGTPRFHTQVRELVRKLPGEEVADRLDGLRQVVEGQRDAYLQSIFGPDLFALLGPETRRLLTRLALSDHALPDDALPTLADLDGPAVSAALRQGIDYGLLQTFLERDLPTLYLIPGLWRPWLAALERLPDADRRLAHARLGRFWRESYERDRERELRISVPAELEACRGHAEQAGDRETFRWGTLRYALLLHRASDFRKAKEMLQAVPENERDLSIWHHLGRAQEALSEWRAARQCFERALQWSHGSLFEDQNELAAVHHNLASVDLREGNHAAARERFGKALALKQAVGDRAGEAATLAQLATVDLQEGNHAAAREGFGRSLALLQMVGDRAGEAAVWHQLATLDLREGDHAAARDGLGKALAIKQAVGDRAGEAATLAQLATVDLQEGNHAAAREGFGRSLALLQMVGDRAGEAAVWHQLASVDLMEGNHAAARDGLGNALAIFQAVGDRAGEAAARYGLASVDLREGNHAAARDGLGNALAIFQAVGDQAGEAAVWHQLGMLAAQYGNLHGGTALVGLCFLIDQSIGHGDAEHDLRTFAEMCNGLVPSPAAAESLLREVLESYQSDRGSTLLREAFARADLTLENTDVKTVNRPPECDVPANLR